jgi:Rgg/GadR/MutR family transcriptional activator
MYGEKFHELRKDNDLSLTTVCQGITSKSALSRWEHGEGHMDADKAVKLIRRIGVNPSEFFTFQYDQLTNQLNQACFDNDLNRLEQLTKIALRKYHAEPGEFINLFNAAVAANFSLLLAKKDLFSDGDREALLEVLENTTYWSQERIDLFGGSIMLLPTDKIVSLASKIVKQLGRIKKISDWQFFNTMGMLLNVPLALLEKQELTEAKKMYRLLDRIYIPEDFMALILRKYLYKLLINYVEGKDEGELDTLLKILDYLGLKHTLSDYQDDFADIRRIYGLE